jgi:hypothetical protein
MIGHVGNTYVFRVTVASNPTVTNLEEACDTFPGASAAVVSGPECQIGTTLSHRASRSLGGLLGVTTNIIGGLEPAPCGSITGLSGLEPTDLWISLQPNVTALSEITLCDANCSALCIIEDDDPVQPFEITTDTPYPPTTFPPDVTVAPQIIDEKAPTVSDYAVFGVVSGSICIFLAVGLVLFLRAH